MESAQHKAFIEVILKMNINQNYNGDSDDDDDDGDDDDDDDDDDEVKYIREAETEKKADASHTGKSITHFHTFYLKNVMSKIL